MESDREVADVISAPIGLSWSDCTGGYSLAYTTTFQDRNMVVLARPPARAFWTAVSIGLDMTSPVALYLPLWVKLLKLWDYIMFNFLLSSDNVFVIYIYDLLAEKSQLMTMLLICHCWPRISFAMVAADSNVAENFVVSHDALVGNDRSCWM